MSSSSFYDYRKRKSLKKEKLSRNRNPKNPLEELRILNYLRYLCQKPFFSSEGGYRKLVLYCKRDLGILCNHKRMYRLCKQERFFFVCAFINVFDIDIKRYHISYHCTHQDILKTLKLALVEHNISQKNNLVLRSDNGPQMTSKRFRNAIKKMPVVHEFIPVRTPNKNAYIESFFSALEINVMANKYFYTFNQAFKTVVELINFYRTQRIHGSLKMSPIHFNSLVKQQ